MTLPLFAALAPIVQRLTAAPHRPVALDDDGTLRPIVDDSSRATFDLHGRNLLQSVAVLPRASVVILRERCLLDVQSLVGLDGLIYAGNHDFESAGPGFRFIGASAAQR